MADLVWPERAAGTEEVIVLQVSSIAFSKATRFAKGWSSGHFPPSEPPVGGLGG